MLGLESSAKKSDLNLLRKTMKIEFNHNRFDMMIDGKTVKEILIEIINLMERRLWWDGEKRFLKRFS